MRWWLIVALVATACAPKRVRWDDPLLPEAVVDIAAQTPLAVLQSGAGSDDPSSRGHALELLIRNAPSPDQGGWATRALWDPEAWIQRRAVVALSDRLPDPKALVLLQAFATRTDALADPYARGAAALRVARTGDTSLAAPMADAWRAQKASWRAAPLQLAAAVLGDTEAIAPLGRALARAEVQLDAGFLIDVGASGLTDLAPALAEGDAWVEEEMRLAYATARLLLDDDGGGKLLRDALDGKDDLAALEALDFLSAVEDPRATDLLRRGRSGGTELARTYAALALLARGDGSPALFDSAIVDEDPEIRGLAVRFAVDAALDPDGPRKAERAARRLVKIGLTDEDLAVQLEALRGATRIRALVPDSDVQGLLSAEILDVRIAAAGVLVAARG